MTDRRGLKSALASPESRPGRWDRRSEPFLRSTCSFLSSCPSLGAPLRPSI